MKILLVGPPGAGKGTQSEALCKDLHLRHLATGDILRAAVASGSELGKKAESIMKAGELVPDDLMVQVVMDFMQSNPAQGYLFDGFPRTLGQARALREQVGELDLVLHMEISRQEVVRRLSGRLLHRPSGRTYHREFLPPKEEGKDDVTGEPLEVRPDDREEAVGRRLDAYEEATFPLLEYYRGLEAEGCTRVVDIRAGGSPEAVASQIRAAAERSKN